MKKRNKLSADRILSLSAIAIALFTFLIYVYQSAIMTEQKHTSVWPYVEWIRSFNTVDGFYIEVTNKGIGPSKISREEFWLADSLLTSVSTEQLIEMLFPGESVEYSYSTLSGRVLVPGESIRRIQFYDLGQAERVDSILKVNNFRYKITYCSVYDDCWSSNGLNVVEED